MRFKVKGERLNVKGEKLKARFFSALSDQRSAINLQRLAINLQRSAINLQRSTFIICFLLIAILSPLFSHHTGTSHNPNATTRFVDPFTGKREQPANYLVLTQDYYRATNENSNVYTTTGFVELPFKQGEFAFNVSVPWTYFEQKGREDAARIGKTYMGGKWLPLADFKKDYFIVLEGNIGFPSGPDTDRFTGGNYYTGQGLITLGYLWRDWSFVIKAGGVQPLSRLEPSNLQDNDGIPFWLRPASADPPRQRYELKKTTLIQTYVTYLLMKEVSLFGGYLYRTPYQGVDFDTRTEDTIPRIFQEVTTGFTYNFSEKYNLTVGYRYPLYRKSDHRLYESAWTVAFSMEWGDPIISPNDDKSKELSEMNRLNL